MAANLSVVKVQGLKELIKGLRAMGDNLDRDMKRELRGAVGPIVSDAKSRFSHLSGTGQKTAAQVSGSATQTGAFVLLRNRGGYEMGREFGGGRYKLSTYTLHGGGWAAGWVGVVHRHVNYSLPSQFGPWTGNKFTLDSSETSGNAFLPAIRAGALDAVGRISEVIDRYLEAASQTGV